MADPLPTTSGPAGLPTTRIPGITQVVHVVKPQAMVGGMLRTSADPLHEIAVTNTVAMRLHNCISVCLQNYTCCIDSLCNISF